ncbi:Kinesin [Macleaya cordata]|uniref:Kinesin n=1 Tax=Macleaya cordata TaxID=56857 RepID=A0A200QSU4_MACCD|nr:Kinesin [Macleaya cordata]
MSSFRVLGRNSDRNTEPEGNENEFENPINLIPFPPSRTPLNTISDPSQNPAEFQDTESDSRVKFEGSRLRRLSDRKIEAWNYGTPRIGVRGKPHSEPNSAQSTPARSGPKVFSGVPTGTCSVIKPPRDIGTRGGGSSSKVSRRISVAPSEPSMDVPHFELVEDSSFWMDHNVQVLIRIRPISTAEKVLQGKFRCLRQDSAHTLTWLGNPETRFTFDHVACETISQEKLFMVAGLPMVENCMSGYNSCMFAYGQTGSGKTYTMMGEIHEMDGNLNKDCGMTPRIFEYLFTRIRAEEENRRDENLKYSCKCSFLEIYNEQITDLLEPSSTNLQLREDARKGVYVENLKEYEVTTVKDVVELLLQGAVNRKMAATHMNSESSRSHSVFTCVIESRWDMDSTTHLRFGRLNLVDLAGSERQKSSGAEGDRLKEAANINKSLSTLGLVIMTLVDVAHGKQRHVPYRDSRLTFLLQDSLGGNSKTTIIANISPSTCSANETLSTLKFAQRAKLIQNNAKVNEGASGDVMALQRQIQQLKDQLTYVLKHQKPSRSLSLCLPNLGQSQLGDFNETNFSSLNGRIPDCLNSTSTPKKKMKCIDTTLTGALRREKMAETAARGLEAEIEHMNRLVHQQEEDAQRTKMILRFREEKIKRLELLTDGLVSADEYLMEENSALYEEIQLLQARIDRNPELTRFALENIRLLEQLRMYEDFYEQGERETLLTEVSELRDQVYRFLNYATMQVQDKDSTKELEDCRRNLEACLQINESLTREVDELQRELNKYLNPSEAAFDSVTESLSRDAETIKQADKHSSVEIISVRTDLDDEIASYIRAEDEVLKIKNDQKMGDTLVVQLSETEKELMEARFLIEAMESEQVHLIEELDILRKENLQYVELFRNEDFGQIQSMLQHENQCEPSEWYKKTEDSGQPDALLIMEDKLTGSVLQSKLDRMNKDLEEARILIRQYQEDHASQLFHQDEVEQVRQQVEVEMAKTILHLQDNLTTLQQELQERLCVMTEENMKLRNTIMSREAEMKSLAEEWEKATIELTTFILDGSRSLEDASNQIGIIAGSFPERKYWISEHVERAAKAFIEKETTIKKLRKSLEDAQKIGLDMELKLSSLKGATLAITDVQQLENDEKDKETLQLRSQLSEKISMIQKLESKLKTKEDQIIEAEKRADAAFVVVKRLSSFPKDAQAKLAEKEIPEFKLAISVEQDKYRISEIKAEENAQAVEAIEESEEGCSNTGKMLHFKLDSARLVAEEKINTASDFLVKLEEAQATMKEADVMLNTLLKANDNAKHMTDRWKQAGKELKIERDSLIEEVQQLTTTICLQQGEYESLQGQFRSSLVEIANSVSSLETFVLQMQRDVEERFKVIYSDISSLGQDLLNCICNSRSSLEDIWSEIMEKGFALFVLYQCHMRGSSEKIWTINSEPFFLPQREKECDSILKGANGIEEADQIEQLHYKLSNPGDILDIRYSLGKVAEYKEEELGLTLDNLISENESLKKELARKDILLKGLLFDLSLLQESTSNSKDIKDETEKMVATLTAIRDELTAKTTQLDDILVEHRKLEAQLADSEAALSLANSKLEQAEEIHDVLSNQNGELRVLVNDLFAKKDDAEEQLEEKKEVIKSLEEEILRMAFSVEEKILSSIEDIEDELRTVTNERDHLREEVISLNDKLEMANALADENEARAVEARQVSEASKIYAEQKEEEAKILERSVEELEYTINVLEKKVYEMGEEVERDQFMRDDLKLELQDPIQQNMNPEYFDIERQREDQTSRHLDDRILELHESKNRIKVLEKERAELAKEIKECRNYISELVLHADAQASLFHQKYNMLEAMVREVKKDASTSTSVAIPSEKTEKSSMRPRGSSSPFRCIQGLVQQMNVEKDQELSMARLRIEELEALASRQQKEVCMLNARLAAAESMTHDVIRDLLAVKLDIINYANLIDQHEVQKLVEEAQEQTEESIAKEQEILKLRKQINDLMEERQSYIKEINQREADILAAQLKVEQLRERDHMLTAQNEMLKMDKTNLKRTVTEMVKKQFVPQNIQQRVQQTTKMKENSFSRVGNEELSKRLMHSEKLLSNVNNELAWYRKSDSRDPYNQNDEQRLRNKRQASAYIEGNAV